MIYGTSPRVQLSQPRFQVLSLASRKAQEREPSERGSGFNFLYHSLFLYDVFYLPLVASDSWTTETVKKLKMTKNTAPCKMKRG